MTSELAGNLIIRDGKILLSRENGQWCTPDGEVREDESPTQTALRAAEDRLGVEADLEKPFFSGEFEDDGELFLWHGYIASIPEDASLNAEDAEDLEWFEPGELDDLELATNLVQILPALRRI